MIKYVYSIDYRLGKKREYVDWVRSIADTLQKPDELKRLASYDNVFAASPNASSSSHSNPWLMPRGISNARR